MYSYKKKNFKGKRCLLVLLSLFICFCLTGCLSKQNSPMTKSDYLLNTIVSVTIYDVTDDTDIILDDCMTKCKEYETLFSKTIEGSDVYRINHAAGEFVEVSSDTINLIETSITYSLLTDGMIDITIAPVKDLWNFSDMENTTIPDEKAIKEALAHVNYKNIEIDGNKVRLTDKSASIDLGFIAKGYIADRLKEYLISKDVKSAIINLGGNVLTIGNKQGTPFKIGIQKPFAKSGTALTSADADDCSVVTSGVYERYFTVDGQNYHHILDAKTGYPAQTGLLSATIISKDSVTGDALSTTCLLLGLERATELIESLENVEAIFITEDLAVIKTAS